MHCLLLFIFKFLACLQQLYRLWTSHFLNHDAVVCKGEAAGHEQLGAGGRTCRKGGGGAGAGSGGDRARRTGCGGRGFPP